MGLLDRSVRGSRSQRLVLSFALVAAAAGLTALGLFTAFAKASRPGHSGAKQRPRLSATPAHLSHVGPLAAGDRADRTVELHYRGRFVAVVLRTAVLHRSLLDSSPTGGLRLKIARCSARWRRVTGKRGYSCPGKASTVLPTVRVRGGRRLRLRHLSRRPGATDHLRLVLTLPAVAGNELQSQASRLAYRFTGVAR
ncbi:MAG TPA: hypothetical protein VKB10_06225 [Gaiellaceae bacterium]|nr:hypothetical protein [Gaiellaceae bacterium]